MSTLQLAVRVLPLCLLR
uniref:Uncharacterized protein n=1 Tax=Rhizophora mucronata TaxID=61149 RepID=A0A2P2QDR6_RHIMU